MNSQLKFAPCGCTQNGTYHDSVYCVEDDEWDADFNRLMLEHDAATPRSNIHENVSERRINEVEPAKSKISSLPTDASIRGQHSLSQQNANSESMQVLAKQDEMFLTDTIPLSMVSPEGTKHLVLNDTECHSAADITGRTNDVALEPASAASNDSPTECYEIQRFKETSKQLGAIRKAIRDNGHVSQDHMDKILNAQAFVDNCHHWMQKQQESAVELRRLLTLVHEKFQKGNRILQSGSPPVQ